MKTKQKAVRSSTRKPAAKIKTLKEITIFPDQEQQYTGSKESVMLARIVNGENLEQVSENTILFPALLSNLTPSLSDVSRRNGMYVGRQLYSMLKSSNKYIMYEESVADLVRFFEHSGYTRITYNIFPDRIDLHMYDNSHEYIGIDLHSFEAGLISGFLTAAKKQYVDVTEHECSNNGSEYCRFTSLHDPYRQQSQRDAKASILRFVDHVTKRTEQLEKKQLVRIAPEYYMLAMSTVLDRPYQEEIQHVASYIGSEIGMRLFTSERTRTSRSAISRIERVMNLLNLGKTTVRSLYPVKIEISFDKLHSKHEFVELAIAFINGLLKNHAIEGASVTRETRRGAYIVNISGKKIGK